MVFSSSTFLLMFLPVVFIGNLLIKKQYASISLLTSKAIFSNPAPVGIDQLDASIEYPTLSAPNSFMMTREAYDKSGGWDPNIGIMFDESDLGERVKSTGYVEYQGYTKCLKQSPSSPSLGGTSNPQGRWSGAVCFFNNSIDNYHENGYYGSSERVTEA